MYIGGEADSQKSAESYQSFHWKNKYTKNIKYKFRSSRFPQSPSMIKMTEEETY